MLYAVGLSSCCTNRAPGRVLTTDAGTSYEVVSEGTIHAAGKQGLLIKYQAAAIDEPKNLREAKEIFDSYRVRAESLGLRLVVITAVVPDKRVGPFYSNKTYNSVFERESDGRWTAVSPHRSDGGARDAASELTGDARGRLDD